MTKTAVQTLRQYAEACLDVEVDADQLSVIAADMERLSGILQKAGPVDVGTEPVQDLRRRLSAAARA